MCVEKLRQGKNENKLWAMKNMMKKVAHTNTLSKRIKMKTVTKDGIRNSTDTHTEHKAPKKKSSCQFLWSLCFFTLLTENDMNSERSEKRMRDRDKNK